MVCEVCVCVCVCLCVPSDMPSRLSLQREKRRVLSGLPWSFTSSAGASPDPTQNGTAPNTYVTAQNTHTHTRTLTLTHSLLHTHKHTHTLSFTHTHTLSHTHT